MILPWLVVAITIVLRHNSLRNIIFTAVKSPHTEVPSLVPGSLSHPANVYLQQWSHRWPAAVDVTVISPLQYHTLPHCASMQGYALSMADKRKCAVHFEDCRNMGLEGCSCWKATKQYFPPLVLGDVIPPTVVAIHCTQGRGRGTAHRDREIIRASPMRQVYLSLCFVCSNERQL